MDKGYMIYAVYDKNDETCLCVGDYYDIIEYIDPTIMKRRFYRIIAKHTLFLDKYYVYRIGYEDDLDNDDESDLKEC